MERPSPAKVEVANPVLTSCLAWHRSQLLKEYIMIRRIATGIIIAGIALVPAAAFAKTYKTEKTCVKHHMLWKDGKCAKA